MNPEDYQDIVLGTMTTTDNAQGTVDELLSQMGFGSEIGNWNPSFTDPSEPIPGGTMPFTDVPEDTWYYTYIESVYKQGLMNGLTDTQFAPNDNLSRAQFATIFYRLAGEPEVEYAPIFPDVPDEYWFTDGILWANSAGIIKGYGDTGLCGPEDNINREQMAVMLYRYAEYKGYDLSAAEDISQFEDAAEVSSFAEQAVSWAVGNDIIIGKENMTILDSQGSASRGECAAVIMRFIEKYEA